MTTALDTRPPHGDRRARARARRGGAFAALREPISRRRRNVLMALSAVLPLLVWVALSASGAVSSLFLPSPGAVVRAFGHLVSNGDLQHDVVATLRRVGISFAIVLVISIPLGLAMGSFRSCRALCELMIGLLRYMPAPAFIPLLIIWLGLGESSKIALLVIGTVFFNTLMSADAASQVPEELIDASYTLGASHWVVMRKVILPHALPGLIDAARVNIAATWNLVVVAELIAAQEGLGFRIVRAQRFLQTDRIFAVLIVIAVIGLAIDVAFRLTRNAAAPWARA